MGMQRNRTKIQIGNSINSELVLAGVHPSGFFYFAKSLDTGGYPF